MTRLLLGLLALLGGTVAGCGGDDDGGTSSPAASAADGEQLYLAHCASCHGADLRGTDEGPSHLSIVYEPSHHPDEAFRAAARQGVAAHHWEFGDMPPVEGLTDADLDAIIAFVRDVQEAEGFEPYPPE